MEDKPWEYEPNEWKGENMLIQRQEFLGHLCGYVGVGPSHPLYGVSYKDEGMPDFVVHGGITFSGKLDDSDLWWFGFDCAHAGDYLPYRRQFLIGHLPSWGPETYKDMGFVRLEITKLATQLVRYIRTHKGDLIA